MPAPELDRLSRLYSLLGERYQFESILGTGGAASVYLVKNLLLNRIEALKVLAKTRDEDAKYHLRFAHEAKISASLNHPNIITIYEFGETAGIFWFTMEYIDGLTLAQILAYYGPLDEPTMIAIALPILEALAYTHQREIVHRDIKPSNIMIDSLGHPRLMDFGIAKTAGNPLQTQTGFILGTPAYIAPEQAAGHALDGRSDIYSLGITLYESLAGHIPFVADSILQMVVKRITETPIPLSTQRPEIHPQIEGIIMKALANNPENRFHHAQEMHDALLDFQLQHPQKANLVELVRASHKEHQQMPTTQMDMATVKLFKNTRKPRLSAIFMALIVLFGLVIFIKMGLFQKHPERPSNTSTLPQKQAASSPLPLPEKKADGLKVDRDALNSVSPENPQSQQGSPMTTKTTQSPTATPPKPVGQSRETASPLPRYPVQMPRLLSDANEGLNGSSLPLCAGKIVNLSVVIGTDGLVKKIRVLYGPDPECANAAKVMVEKYIYAPALDAAGLPVETTIALAIEFPVEK